jgi:hypothetical protein
MGRPRARARARARLPPLPGPSATRSHAAPGCTRQALAAFQGRCVQSGATWPWKWAVSRAVWRVCNQEPRIHCGQISATRSRKLVGYRVSMHIEPDVRGHSPYLLRGDNATMLAIIYLSPRTPTQSARLLPMALKLLVCVYHTVYGVCNHAEILPSGGASKTVARSSFLARPGTGQE